MTQTPSAIVLLAIAKNVAGFVVIPNAYLGAVTVDTSGVAGNTLQPVIAKGIVMPNRVINTLREIVQGVVFVLNILCVVCGADAVEVPAVGVVVVVAAPSVT